MESHGRHNDTHAGNPGWVDMSTLAPPQMPFLSLQIWSFQPNDPLIRFTSGFARASGTLNTSPEALVRAKDLVSEGRGSKMRECSFEIRVQWDEGDC